jgi:hypothetical protein
MLNGDTFQAEGVPVEDSAGDSGSRLQVLTVMTLHVSETAASASSWAPGLRPADVAFEPVCPVNTQQWTDKL